jgi:hypothetical protein
MRRYRCRDAVRNLTAADAAQQVTRRLRRFTFICFDASKRPADGTGARRVALLIWPAGPRAAIGDSVVHG